METAGVLNRTVAEAVVAVGGSRAWRREMNVGAKQHGHGVATRIPDWVGKHVQLDQIGPDGRTRHADVKTICKAKALSGS